MDIGPPEVEEGTFESPYWDREGESFPMLDLGDAK